MLVRTVITTFLLLAPAPLVLAQSPGSAPAPANNQACAPSRPISTPPSVSGAKAAPDDTKLPGGGVGCTNTGAPLETTRTDPGAGVMVTSPTGMMTNPGLQPMPDAPKTNQPK